MHAQRNLDLGGEVPRLYEELDPERAILPEVYSLHHAMPIDSFAEEYKHSEVSISLDLNTTLVPLTKSTKTERRVRMVA